MNMKNEINKQFAIKLLKYIEENNLKNHILDNFNYMNDFHSEYVIGESFGCDWMNRCAIDYSVKYYYGDTFLYEKEEQISYDEFDYIGTNQKPIQFDIKIKIPEYLLLRELEKLDMSSLTFIASEIGISSIEIQKMIIEIKLEENNSEQLKEINKKISQITALRNRLQSIKDELLLIGNNNGRKCDEEVLKISVLTKEFEEYINKLENEIEEEKQSILRLK